MSKLPTEKPCVLIVDDQMSAIRLLEKIFTTDGYEVHIAHNGIEALEQLHQITPDIILLDIMMPKMDGYETLERLRDNPRFVEIPTILITAKDTVDALEKGLELGADDFVSKPFNPRELLARAKNRIESKRLKRDLHNRTQDLGALLRVSEELRYQLGLNDLRTLISYLVIDLLPCDLVAVYYLDDQQNIIESHINQSDGTFNTTYQKEFESIVQTYLAEQTPLLWHDQKTISTQFLSGLAVSLEYDNQLQGVIVVVGERPYNDHHLRLLDGISRQVSLALKTSELFGIQAIYAEGLEEMVEERTTELKSAHQMLVRSEKLVSVGRLAAGIAHEINNPLFPLRINLEHMVEDIQENVPIQQADVEKTLESVERISRIVTRLLEFTGKGREFSLEVSPLNINEILENVMALSRKVLEHQKIQLETKFSELPLVHGNRDQLEQVFLNLMLNAKAAMGHGGMLQIETAVENNEVVIIVRDNGSGIRPELIEDIFEPFVSTKEDGTGLGLFISYMVMQNHNGSIDVESEVGQGTQFTIRLPLNMNELA